MANIVPGVVWQPVDVGNRAARRKGRGLCGHVAVSGSKNLAPGPLSTRSADWHFYLPKAGPAIQYIDLDLQCWATGAGNATMAAFESEGGLGTTAQVNAEPWTDNQLDWAARILRHMHDTEGVPLRVMESSAATERGFGTHRLGVPGYMTTGEQWSSARGKACPGDAKHAQRFEIVRRAIEGDDMPTLDEIRKAVLDTDLGDGVSLAEFVRKNTKLRDAAGQALAIYQQVLDVDIEKDKSLADLVKISGGQADVDPETLAAALKDALGDQLAADVAARLTVSAKPTSTS